MSFKMFLLLLVAIICSVFIYLKVQAMGDKNSYFNQTTRYSFGKSTFLRNILGLHNDGDARGWYLQGDSALVVEVVHPGGMVISSPVIDRVIRTIRDMTGRPVDFYSVDIIQDGTLTDVDIEKIIDEKRRHVLPGQPNLFIIYAEDFPADGEEVGKTYKEFAVVLSHNRISELTRSYRGAMDEYVESTLLHEIGHQFGLGHNDGSGCIMNAVVESPKRSVQFSGQFTPTKFCTQELEELGRIKAQLQ